MASERRKLLTSAGLGGSGIELRHFMPDGSRSGIAGSNVVRTTAASSTDAPRDTSILRDDQRMGATGRIVVGD